MATRGAIVWEGASPVDGAPIVMIVTGLTGRASHNRKTGEMIQTWILRADMDPVAAIREDADASICGGCPLRGVNADGKRTRRACYVNVGQASLSVFRAYARGSYPRMSPEEIAPMLEGKAIRLGAYGDPAMVPLAVLETLVSRARVWTGYTHQWRDIDPGYGRLLMASADSVADRKAARARGYRSFYVAPVGDDIGRHARAMECASTRTRNPLSCADCGACAGTRNGAASSAVDIVILAHGTGARYVGA